MEDGGEPSNKKSRLQEEDEEEEPMAVKEERPERREGQGGEGALVAVEEAMQIPWVAAEVNPLFYLCFACQLPLRPPVHQCEGGHRVCGRCHGDRCTACDPPAAYSPFPFMDDALGAVRLPCCYKADGCGRKLMYHEAADHALGCAFAPCHCPAHGCSMWASPPALLDHIAAAHSWPVTEVGYGSPFRIAVPAPWRGGGTHLLVERNDRRLFLVTLSEFGHATAVSVVCVREGTAPRFRSTGLRLPATRRKICFVASPRCRAAAAAAIFPVEGRRCACWCHRILGATAKTSSSVFALTSSDPSTAQQVSLYKLLL